MGSSKVGSQPLHGKKHPKAMRTSRVLRSIEVAYDLGLSSDSWRSELSKALAAWMDEGPGLLLLTTELGDDGSLPVHHETVGPSHLLDTIRQIELASDAPELVAIYRRTRVVALSTLPDRLPEIRTRLMGGLTGEVRDMHCINALWNGEHGIGVAAGRTRPTPMTAREVELYDGVAHHLAAASRLRHMLTHGSLCVEALLGDDGEVIDAVGAAKPAASREVLREAVRQADRARMASGRRDPEEAVRLWSNLVAGRWTIVDRFDHDGRRFHAAIVNDPRCCSIRRLSPGETQLVAMAVRGMSQKVMALELGADEATVSRRLSRAMKKLGVRSRAELCAVLRDTPTDVLEEATQEIPLPADVAVNPWVVNS